MSVVRIFVCSLAGNDARTARQLISDLEAQNIEVITGNEALAEEDFLAFLEEELPDCQHLLLIRTPESSRSARFQQAFQIARPLVESQRTGPILSWLAAGDYILTQWDVERVFDASRDYDRALAQLFLVLRPSSGNTSPPFGGGTRQNDVILPGLPQEEAQPIPGTGSNASTLPPSSQAHSDWPPGYTPQSASADDTQAQPVQPVSRSAVACA